MSFDPITFKKQFPLFSQQENKSLVYLDNASTTQKPDAVIQAISDFYIKDNGNAQRASHRLARQATAMIETVRQQTATFLGTEKKEAIVFTRGATESLNLIAYGLRPQLTAADTIVINSAEHHANILPWQEASRATGCQLRLISSNLQTLSQTTADERQSIKIVALTIASNALGNTTDVAKICEMKALLPNAIIVLDITQWLAHQPITLSTIPCDFAACSAHKFYGPTGVGILYGKTKWLQKLAPLIVGGEMVKTVNTTVSIYQDGFQKFEAGTASMAAIAGLGACLDFWRKQDRQAIATHEIQLTHYLHQKLIQLCQAYPECQLLTQAENNIGIASINCGSPYNNYDCALWLDEHNIAVRVGEHCTQLLWKEHYPELKNGTIRFSIAAYNTRKDIDQTIEAITQYLHYIQNHLCLESIHHFAAMNWQALLQLSSWQQRYKQLIFWGKSIPTQPHIRQDKFLINGCESPVWLRHQMDNDQHIFMIDSDSDVIKGLAALFLCRIHGKTSEAIAAVDFENYFNDLGLAKHLSPSRNNGFLKIYQAAMKKINTP